MFPIFMRHKEKCDLFSKDHHISAFGARIIGEYVADYIRNSTDKVDEVLHLSRDRCRLYMSDYGNPEMQIEDADVYYITEENVKVYFWNQRKEEARVVIFGDCNLQSYSSQGAGISANLSYYLKHPVYNAGRMLVYGSEERPITPKELENMLKFDIVVYINFASAPYVRTAAFSLRHPALNYKWCSFNIKQ